VRSVALGEWDRAGESTVTHVARAARSGVGLRRLAIRQARADDRSRTHASASCSDKGGVEWLWSGWVGSLAVTTRAGGSHNSPSLLGGCCQPLSLCRHILKGRVNALVKPHTQQVSREDRKRLQHRIPPCQSEEPLPPS
jgi:hypothetical protein